MWNCIIFCLLLFVQCPLGGNWSCIHNNKYMNMQTTLPMDCQVQGNCLITGPHISKPDCNDDSVEAIDCQSQWNNSKTGQMVLTSLALQCAICLSCCEQCVYHAICVSWNEHFIMQCAICVLCHEQFVYHAVSNMCIIQCVIRVSCNDQFVYHAMCNLCIIQCAICISCNEHYTCHAMCNLYVYLYVSSNVQCATCVSWNEQWVYHAMCNTCSMQRAMRVLCNMQWVMSNALHWVSKPFHRIE